MSDVVGQSSVAASPFVIARHRVVIEFRTSGRLVPWLGPAFRGITALRYRAASCTQPRETWTSTWRYCRGCPHMSTCGYGLVFEPDAVASEGARDAPRPLVIAPEFPVSQRATAGQQVHLDIITIGAAAGATVPGVLRALVDAGRFDGLGPDRVRFNVVFDQEPPLRTAIDPALLPKEASPLPVVRNVTLRLSSPLFLRERGGNGNRRQILRPTLENLFQASMRVAREFLGEAALCPGRGHLDLDDLAGAIEPTLGSVEPFTQDKASHRSRDRFRLEGVTGAWSFAWLPACLVPWLQLGGLLHVGGHRIAGAGGWGLTFDAPEPPAGGSP